MQLDIRGPVFVSYRHSDGADLALRVAWQLRAVGLPVWLDTADMGVGDFRNRMREALGQGPSAGVLIATPDVKSSDAIRKIEYPLLAKMSRDDGLSLAIVNPAITADGGMDYSAPSSLYPKVRGVDLSNYNQFAASDRAKVAELGRLLMVERMDRLRSNIAARGGVVRISIQTRNAPQAGDRSEGDLDVRLRDNPDGRLPNPEGFHDFAANAASMTAAVVTAGGKALEISGGGHLSVLIALGALFPAQRIPAMTFVPPSGERWESKETVVRPASPPLTVASALTHRSAAGSRDVLAFIDLLPATNQEPIKVLAQRPEGWADALHLTCHQRGMVPPENGAALSAEIAWHLRELANANPGSAVHVAFAGPAPIAALLGRHLNMLTATAYEMSPEPTGDWAYVPAVTVEPGASSTHLTVHLPAHPGVAL